MYSPTQYLKAKTVRLTDLLGEGFFHIPAYQRDYSWQPDNVAAMWSDLERVYATAWTPGGPVANPSPHFFGPIVLQSPEAEDEPDSPFEVIDGQQRLITFTILLAVLADAARSIANAEKALKWASTLDSLRFVPVMGDFRQRVEPGRSASAFKKIFGSTATHESRRLAIDAAIAAQPRAEELERMQDAYELFYERVEDLLGQAPNDAERDEILERFIRTTLELTVFLRMKVNELGVAYDVFEGLNARGLELSQSDLIKNKLFQLADTQGSLEEVRAEWESASTLIRESGQTLIDMPAFLLLHHLVFHGPVKQTNLYDQVANATLNQTVKNSVTAIQYSKSVHKVAKRVAAVLQAGADFNGTDTRNIEAIRDTLGNRYAMAPIFATAMHFTIGSDELSDVIRLSHHFAFRRFVAERTGLGTYQNEIVEAAKTLAASGDVGAFTEILRATSSDASFKAAFGTISARTHKEGFYVCEMIEHHLGAKAGMLPHGQSPTQHLEHIFPKKPKSGEWREYSPEEHGSWVNRFGNLLVLEADINQVIKNRSFAFKSSNERKKDYSHSALSMPRSLDDFLEDLGDGPEWTASSIEKRSAFLAETYATTVWKI